MSKREPRKARQFGWRGDRRADPAAGHRPGRPDAHRELQDAWTATASAFYPDWPAPGYYQRERWQKTQALIGGTITPEQFVEEIAKPYNEAEAEAN